MLNVDPSIIGFLISAILAMSGFIVWLVKKIISLTQDCSETMKDVRNAVTNNTSAIEDNSIALRELRTTILTIKS